MWNDPEPLNVLQVALQWGAIVLVFLGAIAQVITLVLSPKGKTNPLADKWSSGLQWLAIVLVVLGGVIQIATLAVGEREKDLSAVLAESNRLQEEARQGSWASYQQLVDLADAPGPFHDVIQRHVRLVQNEMLAYRDIPALRSDLGYIVNGKNIPMQSLTAAQMFQLVARPDSSTLMRQSLQHYMLEKPNAEVIRACHTVLSQSDSLPARAAACGVLARVLGLKASFLECEKWKQICEEEIERTQQED